MKKILFSVISILISTLSVFANGGGTYAISAAAGSGNPVFRDIEEVILLSEKLYIKLSQTSHQVTVKYILWNQSDNDYTDLDYAFPVDYLHADEGSGIANAYSFQWNDYYISNISFMQGRNILPFHSSKTEIIQDIFPNLNTYWENRRGIHPNARRWFYTKLNLKKNSFTTLTVTYTLSNLRLSDGDSPCVLDYWSAASSFLYDFSPASHWGDGMIRDFYVEIDLQDLFLSGDIKKAANIHITGMDFQESGNRLLYQTRNFDLKNVEPLCIQYTSQTVSSTNLLSNHWLSDSQYSIHTSPSQPNYPASNLNDLNMETVWVPIDSKGGWIEYTFKEPTFLGGFILVNGYHKNEQTFTRNNRIKELKISWQHAGEEEWYDYTITETNYLENTLKNLPYQPVYWENLINCDNVLFYQFCDLFSSELKKLRFTIEDIHPGSAHDDTCISELILLQ